MQALAAVLGGTQSLHTNGRDEALSLPTEEAVQIALRTQQIIAHESGVADTVDPLAGSYAIESLTDQIEEKAWAYNKTIDEMGGAIAAVEDGYVAEEIHEAAYQFQRGLEDGSETVVGVNKFTTDEPMKMEVLKLDPAIEEGQRQHLANLRANRDNAKVAELRSQLASAAASDENLMPLFVTCVENDMTLGEICHTLRDVWGEYRPVA